MLAEISNHLWHSTVFAGLVGLLTVAFRKNRAQVRYWLWLCASIKFLVPFSALMSLGSLLPWPAPKTNPPAVVYTLVEMSAPFTGTGAPVPASHVSGELLPIAASVLWACGFVLIALLRLRGWLRIQAAVRASTPASIAAPIEVRSSPTLLEPGVVGLFRPILLLPASLMEHLTAPQLAAVLAHELCHVRRRDNLTAAIHMIVEAVFWFHPMVWWIGARLVKERELACDEEVLRLGNDSEDYAQGILTVCRMYAASPLGCVSGVTGSDLKQRIRAILAGRIPYDLNFRKKAALATAAAIAASLPIVVGVMSTRTVRAQVAGPKFEVASIKPCGSGFSGGRGGRGGSFPAHGNLNIECVTVIDLMHSAYVTWANGHLNPPKSLRIGGGPAWIYSERYTINAKSESDVGMMQMSGPMLQALLADRLRLKTHLETREIPVYDLVAEKGGPKLQPAQAGSCTPFDFDNPPALPTEPRRNYCGTVRAQESRPGTLTIQYHVMSIAQFANELPVDRLVIDKTGLTGLFDLQMEFELGGATMGEFMRSLTSGGGTTGDPSGPSIFTALEQQLGLKLEPARGPGQFLVIDHVEKPSEN